MIAYFHDDLNFDSEDPEVMHLSLTVIDEINKLNGFYGNASFFKSIKLINNSDLFIEYVPEQHNISKTKVLTNLISKNKTLNNDGKDRIPCGNYSYSILKIDKYISKLLFILSNI